jgi:glycosyltransferase involved in cell wall biosynthesis
LTFEEALGEADKFDLIALHKPCSVELLLRYKIEFGERLVFWVHDHDVYCPRRYYYTPFGRKNCSRKCALPRCAMCALLSSPRRWQGGIKGEFKFLFCDVPRRLELLRDTRTVVISEFMRDNLLKNGFNRDKISVISPFIEPCPKSHEEKKPEKMRLLFLGQLIRGKGCDLFLQMLQYLKIPFHAMVAGEGNDHAMLQKLCQNLDLTEKVEFLGWCSSPEELFKQCDVLIFPSRWQEPFGLSGLEAIAHGVPVAGFDVGGVREFLIDQKTGILIRPFNLEDMAETVTRLYADSGLRQELGDNGIKLAREKFSKQHFLTEFQNLFNDETK